MVKEKEGYGNIVAKSFRTLEKKGIVKPILAMEGMDFFKRDMKGLLKEVIQ